MTIDIAAGVGGANSARAASASFLAVSSIANNLSSSAFFAFLLLIKISILILV